MDRQSPSLHTQSKAFLKSPGSCLHGARLETASQDLWNPGEFSISEEVGTSWRAEGYHAQKGETWSVALTRFDHETSTWQ